MKTYSDISELKKDIDTVEFQLNDWFKFTNRHYYGNSHAKAYIVLLRRLRKNLEEIQ